LPNTGWRGVFRVAIIFDILAALLAFFVLRRMKAPVKSREEATTVSQPQLTAIKARGAA
jgi:predicted MFS family arabinose efflux permease